MKRSPRSGEQALVHATERTGHVQTFAICQENYNPAILKQMRSMRDQPLMGYKLGEVETADGHIRFSVLREDGTALTSNSVTQHDGKVLLSTRIIQPMPPGEAVMIADLEHCAALMLIESAQEDKAS